MGASGEQAYFEEGIGPVSVIPVVTGDAPASVSRLRNTKPQSMLDQHTQHRGEVAVVAAA